MANSVAVALGPQPAGIGNRHILIMDVTIDTYAEGGVAVAVPSSITQPIVIVQASNGFGAEWDSENSKVILYSASATEVESLTDAVKVTLMFIGQ